MTARLLASHLPGAIPTMNGRGFMLEALDGFAEEFIRTAAAGTAESLDIGCAYGVATLAALERGARMCACDMEQKHLDLVVERAPPGQRARLRTVAGLLPGVQFAPESFDAILASRVIHFLSGEEIRVAMAQMRDWLRPGGRLFLVVDTPYMPGWAAIAPGYEAAKARGEPWPGYIPDFSVFTRNNDFNTPGPKFLNTLDPDILARECERVGLVVERTGWFGMQRLGEQSGGREHAGCVARKP